MSDIQVGERMREGEVSESLVESIRQNGLLQPIIVRKTNSGYELVAGMHRLLAIKKLGWNEVSVCVSDRDPRIVEIDENLVRKELTVLEKCEQIVLKKKLYEGKGFASETAKLMNASPRLVFLYLKVGSASDEMRAWFRENKMDDDLRRMLKKIQHTKEANPYSQKVEGPTYKVTGVKPAIADMLDSSRVQELQKQIEATAGLEPALRAFLLAAATRHHRFNYRNIAEYYAHAPANVQKLMEESALVILDFDRAVELGFVKLSEEITKSYLEEHK